MTEEMRCNSKRIFIFTYDVMIVVETKALVEKEKLKTCFGKKKIGYNGSKTKYIRICKSCIRVQKVIVRIYLTGNKYCKQKLKKKPTGKIVKTKKNKKLPAEYPKCFFPT